MDARKALQELADAVYAEIIRKLHSSIGYNDSTTPPKNTLIGSKLEKSIKLYPDGEDEIVFVIADYFSYVTQGRHHGMKEPDAHTMDAIFKWVTRKHIVLEDDDGKKKIEDPNVVAAKVYYSLKFKRDLPPRPFLGQEGYDYKDEKYVDQVITFLDDMVDAWMDDLYDTLINSI